MSQEHAVMEGFGARVSCFSCVGSVAASQPLTSPLLTINLRRGVMGELVSFHLSSQ